MARGEELPTAKEAMEEEGTEDTEVVTEEAASAVDTVADMGADSVEYRL